MSGIKNFTTLFSQKPNLFILKKVLECFEIDDVYNHKIISRIHMNTKQICINMTNIIPELSLFYHLRLINNFFYINNITFIRCISILRNILYQLDYILLRTEHFIDKRKIICYKIANKKDYEDNRHNKIYIQKSTKLCIFD